MREEGDQTREGHTGVFDIMIMSVFWIRWWVFQHLLFHSLYLNIFCQLYFIYSILKKDKKKELDIKNNVTHK